MSPCVHPIDPIDVQAIAAGEEPLLAADAAEHARGCAACGEEVARARRFVESLEDAAEEVGVADLAERIVRLRAFSPRERRDFVLWRGACFLSAGLFCLGLLLLTLPGLTLREQAGLGLATLAPLAMLWRALVQSAVQTLAAAPAGLQALSEALRREQALGLAALVLLAPILFALRRTLARARR